MSGHKSGHHHHTATPTATPSATPSPPPHRHHTVPLLPQPHRHHHTATPTTTPPLPQPHHHHSPSPPPLIHHAPQRKTPTTAMTLPSRVSFKSEYLQDHYLCSRPLDPEWPYQRFETGIDIGNLAVAKELCPTPDGYYRIKDLYFNKFWKRSPNWIWADAGPNDDSKDTLFSIVKINDNNVFAIKSLGNNNFCGPLTFEDKANCMNACYPRLTNEARLVIEETVLERKISNIQYRLSKSRIYEEQNTECDFAYANNNSRDQSSSVTLNFSMTDSKTTSWSNTVSIKFGGKIGFDVSAVPLIATAKVELSTEVGYTHVWGGSESKSFARGSSYTVTVPPLTTMKVTMLCTRAACDVPFSYTQTDLLPSGEWVSITKLDGMFTGMNSYNFRFQSDKVPKNQVHQQRHKRHGDVG